MIFKALKSLFQRDASSISVAGDVAGMISQLNEISNGLGEYAAVAFGDDNSLKESKAVEMISIITDIEIRSDIIKNTDLFYYLAIAYRNYCAWFARGDGRKPFLEKCIVNLEKSISVDSANDKAKSELGRVLIDEKIVRDRQRGIKILKKQKSEGAMPSYLNSVLSKAVRQSGVVEIDHKFDLCSFTDPSPAVFREERKRFRVLIRKYKKQKNSDQLRAVLNQYYNLAVLVTVCYGEHDCNSAVAGAEYDKAMRVVSKICKKIDFSYSSHGYLQNSNFISKNDWKTFVGEFGENKRKFDPKNKIN